MYRYQSHSILADFQLMQNSYLLKCYSKFQALVLLLQCQREIEVGYGHIFFNR